MPPSSKAQLVASGRIRQRQTTYAAILLLAGVVNYLDRSTLAIGNPLIRHDLGLSVADMGLLLSAFLWAYAIAQLPAGMAVDRIGPRRLLGAALVVWSTAQVVTGFVSNFTQFVIARVVLGIGESPSFPSFVRVLREWHSPNDRTVPTSIVCSGPSSIGPALAPPLLTALMVATGWRMMIILTGLCGIVVAAIWMRLYRNPAEIALEPEERRYLADETETTSDAGASLAGWRKLFSQRITWGIMGGNFGLMYLQWLYLAWLPGYLEIDRHMSISRTGVVASIPFVFGMAGSIAGGWFCKRLMNLGVAPIPSCKIPIVAGMILAASATAAVTMAPTDGTAIAAVSFALFFTSCASGTAWALTGIAAPRSFTASLASIQNFSGYLGGALAPAITGFVVQATRTFVPALWSAAAIACVSAMSYLIVVPNKKLTFADGQGTGEPLLKGAMP
jgi:sugar phosphate permease